MTGSKPTRSPLRSRPRRLRLLGVSCAALVVVAGLAGQAAAADPDAPLLRAAPGDVIPGSYIVGLKPQADPTASVQRARRRGGKIRHEFRAVLRGYSANLDEAALAAVRQDPEVAYVEENQVVRPAGTSTNVTWGLDRIDQATLPLNGTLSTAGTGAGVTAYVIDSGIRETHEEFQGRVAQGADFTGLGTTTDCYGHGTHVAADIGGKTYGVAKEVTLVPVRVFDCNGGGQGASVENVSRAVEWVTLNGTAPAVVNMSLEVGSSATLMGTVQKSIAAGFTYVVSAGNAAGGDTDACKVSPANVTDAITVGASTSSDARWVNTATDQSDVGACVDLFAPGAAIKSAYATSDKATATGSGTSFAAPFVAGVAALYLQANPKAGPAEVQAVIVGLATPNVLTGIPAGTANLLLYYPADAAGNPMLYLARSAGTSGDALELNALTTAVSTGQSVTSQPTRFNARDAADGRLQTIGADLWFTRYRNTASGTVEVASATAVSGYADGQPTTATRLGAGLSAQGLFQVVGNDLWMMKIRATTGGTVELFSATAASGYTKGYRAMPTTFDIRDADNGVWQVGAVTWLTVGKPLVSDYYADLWFIKTRNTDSGKIEVFCQAAASNYDKCLGTYKASQIPLGEGANGTFMIIGKDLWFIKVRNTRFGKVEVWTASYASQYQTVRKIVTGWPAADADAGTWSVSTG